MRLFHTANCKKLYTNVDNLDALEYSFEREIPNLIKTWGRS